MRSLSKQLIPLFTSLFLMHSLSAQSAEPTEPLTVQIGSQSEELRRTLLLPERGQSMESVKDRLGDPQSANTVGKPAITSWKYRDMTIYFEGTTVLRAVVHHRPQNTQPTTLAKENKKSEGESTF